MTRRRRWQRSLIGLPLNPDVGMVGWLCAGYLAVGLGCGFLAWRAYQRNRPAFMGSDLDLPAAAFFWSALGALAVWLSVRSLIYRRSLAAERWHRRGLAALRADRHEEARGCFRRALALDPALWQAHYHAGLSWARSGMLDQARKQFAAARNLAPHAPGPALALASTLDDLGRESAARSLLTDLLAHDPQNCDALCLLGYLDAKNGASDAARERFRTVLALAPDHAAARRNLTQLEREQAADNGSPSHSAPAKLEERLS